MQSGLFIVILILQPQRLVRRSSYVRLPFQMAQAGIVTKPNQIAVLIGYFSRNADLVAVEVMGLLMAFSVFVGPVVYLCQRFVAVRIGVDIGIPAGRINFLQEVALVPSEAGLIFEVV